MQSRAPDCSPAGRDHERYPPFVQQGCDVLPVGATRQTACALECKPQTAPSPLAKALQHRRRGMAASLPVSWGRDTCKRRRCMWIAIRSGRE